MFFSERAFCKCLGDILIRLLFLFLMIRRPPRSTLDRSSAASDVYKRQDLVGPHGVVLGNPPGDCVVLLVTDDRRLRRPHQCLSLIHISEPTRPY